MKRYKALVQVIDQTTNEQVYIGDREFELGDGDPHDLGYDIEDALYARMEKWD